MVGMHVAEKVFGMTLKLCRKLVKFHAWLSTALSLLDRRILLPCHRSLRPLLDRILLPCHLRPVP
jgi:hypothetical protein